MIVLTSCTHLETLSAMINRVRRACDDDVDRVRYVGASTWPATYGALKGARYVMEGLDSFWSADAIRASIDAGNIDVAETPHGVVGMIEVEDLGDDLVMWKLYVVPAEQGSGLGRALVGAAKDRARERGRDLLTEYDPDNSAVGGFYAREGFERTEPPWPGTDAVWLRWRSAR